MGSQSDLDQGGTFRQWGRQYLGPTVGWVNLPYENILDITAAGIYNLNLSTTLVRVDVAGAVTINLPSALGSGSLGGTGGTTEGATPGVAAKYPITIVDIGGFALLNPILIQPVSGIVGYTGAVETIMGLTSISLSVNYGGYTLQPIPKTSSWNSISP